MNGEGEAEYKRRQFFYLKDLIWDSFGVCVRVNINTPNCSDGRRRACIYRTAPATTTPLCPGLPARPPRLFVLAKPARERKDRQTHTQNRGEMQLRLHIGPNQPTSQRWPWSVIAVAAHALRNGTIRRACQGGSLTALPLGTQLSALC